MPNGKLHPAVPYLQEQLRKGKISRREFIRYAVLLGTSFAAASTLAAVPQPEADVLSTISVKPAPRKAVTPVRGGTLKIASRVHKVTHPAQFSWVAPSNQLRQVAEYLTQTDENNITHPLLLEKWEASEDLKTWTLYLRKGIKHNNGDEFNADDVVFTFGQWLNEDVGSSMLGLMSYLKPENVEKVDDYTVRLHLDRPEIAVPEHLFHYPALVLNHRTFEGDFLKAPHGTGPYTLVEYSEGGRVLLKRREDYWQKGEDGKPLPYLDAMEWIDMGEDFTAWMAAIRAGEVDVLDMGDLGGIDAYLGLKDAPDITLLQAATAQVRVLRMRVDMEPWSDNNVRMALKLCQNREKIMNLAYFGQGLLGADFHVYPKHPEYCEKPIPKYDPERAKQLLAEAGYPDGLEVNLAVGTGWPDVVSYAEVLKEDAAAAGFKININTMPNAQYWEKWTEVDLGITPWTHRPLGTMVLNLGYTADADGNPVPWNETRWVDDEFNQLLIQANGTLDVEERRKIFCQLEQIMMDRGPIGIAWWQNIHIPFRKIVHGVPPHPTAYALFNQVGKETA
ncbi:MAG: ABC transporter substrate-binding protein [Anaerolineae bacterium]